MGKHLQHKYSASPMENSDPGCVWSLLHTIKYHHWRYFKKRLTPKWHGNGIGRGRHVARVGNPVNDTNALSDDKMKKENSAEMDNSVVGKKMTLSTPESKGSVKARLKALISEEISTPESKGSVKARLKALISEEISKQKGRHHRSSSCPTRSHLMRSDSIHHLQHPDLDTLTDFELDDGSPRTVHQKHESSSFTSTLDPLPLVSCEDPITRNNGCEECGTMFTGDCLEHNLLDEYRKQPTENHTLFQEKLDDAKHMLEQKLIHAKELTTDASLQKKEFLDALDIINVNKNFLLKFLQDPDSPLAQHFHNQQAFSAKMGLTKCESLPLAGSTGGRGSGPSKLKHMQEGIESHAKEKKKFHVGSQSQKSDESKYSGDFVKQLMPYKTEYEADGILKPNKNTAEFANNSSLGSVHQLKNRSEIRENQVVVKRFKDLRQKIKHVIKESRKERHRITMDAILHKIPHGCEFSEERKKEIVNQLKDPAMNREGKYSPGSSYDSVASLSRGQTRHMRRTSSFNESMDRYCQLYETSFNREAKYRTSERSKLRKKEASSPPGNSPKSLARVLSLPNLTSCTYRSEDSSECFSSGIINRNVADVSVSIGSSFVEHKSLDLPIDSENRLHLDTLLESKIQENLVGAGEINVVAGDEAGPISITNHEADAKVGLIVDDFDNLTAKDIASHNEDIGPIEEPISQLEELIPVSLADSNFLEDTASTKEFLSSEDSEVKVRLLNGLDNLAKQQHESGMDTPKVAESGGELQKVEFLNYLTDHEILQLQVDAKDKAEFDYVRDILELSGFSGTESLGRWHSDDQPLDPLMFEEVEGCFLLDPGCSGNEEGGNCTHLLLFDLVNEVLMEIYGKSYSYFPMPLCPLSHIRPMPAGHHVLEEVWALISWYLCSRLEFHQSLDHVVSRDLTKRDGWMNLKFDSECVALELEDSIFDDLIEEVLLA